MDTPSRDVPKLEASWLPVRAAGPTGRGCAGITLGALTSIALTMLGQGLAGWWPWANSLWFVGYCAGLAVAMVWVRRRHALSGPIVEVAQALQYQISRDTDPFGVAFGRGPRRSVVTLDRTMVRVTIQGSPTVPWALLQRLEPPELYGSVEGGGTRWRVDARPVGFLSDASQIARVVTVFLGAIDRVMALDPSGSLEQPEMKLLGELLEHRDPLLRLRAAERLARADIVQALALDPAVDPSVRREAASWLRVGFEAMLSPIAHVFLLTDTSRHLVRYGGYLAHDLRLVERLPVPVEIRELQPDSIDDEGAADLALAFARRGPREQKKLLALAQFSSPVVQLRAVLGLLQVGDAEALPLLGELAKRPGLAESTRRAKEAILARLGWDPDEQSGHLAVTEGSAVGGLSAATGSGALSPAEPKPRTEVGAARKRKEDDTL